MSDLRVIPSAALTVTAIALLAFVTMHPQAAMWAAVVALILAVAGLFTLAVENVNLRAEADDAERRIEALEDALVGAEREAHEAAASMASQIKPTTTALPLGPDVVRVPLLRVVRPEIPPQRDGSEYEWPRIARAIGIEGDDA